MTSLTEESVLSIVRQYRDFHVEEQAIQTEIKNFKKRYQKRLNEIKEHKENMEGQLLDYMREHDHPALRFQEVDILPEEKLKNKNRKLREEEIQSILQKHRIDPSNTLYRELLESIQNSRIREGTKKLRIKINSQTK